MLFVYRSAWPLKAFFEILLKGYSTDFCKHFIVQNVNNFERPRPRQRQRQTERDRERKREKERERERKRERVQEETKANLFLKFGKYGRSLLKRITKLVLLL